MTSYLQKHPFLQAIELLNSKNARDCWMINSFFSAFERFDGTISGHNMLFPMLNLDKLDMISKAIVQSKALDYKTSNISGDEFGKLMNFMIDAKDYDSEQDKVTLTNDEFFTKFFILTANSQVRFQHSDFRERMARTYALMQYIPENNKEILQQRLSNNFIDIPIILEEKYGIKPKAFFIFSWLIFVQYCRLIKEVFIIPDSERNLEISVRHDEARRATICFQIIKRMLHELRCSTAKNQLFITPAIENNDHPLFSKKHFDGFLSIAGRTKKELQEESYRCPIYRVGNYSYSLSPLERFPLVKQSDGSFIIPNMRYYETAIPQILHYELQDCYPGNEYNDLTGAIQELYIQDLLKQRLPNIPVIPEITYKRGKNEVKGPDFTLIDDNGRPILIESKSKRFQARTRILADSNSIDSDLHRIFDAFSKLPLKYKELFSGLSEYSIYDRFLQTANMNNPVHVVVVYGNIELLPEMVNDYLRRNPETPLQDYPYSFCIIDLVDFEYAVEVAATGTKHLSDLLTDYWVSASNVFTGKKPVQNLYSFKYDHDNCYNSKYKNILFKDLRETEC